MGAIPFALQIGPAPETVGDRAVLPRASEPQSGLDFRGRLHMCRMT